MLQVVALCFFLQVQPFDILIQHAHIVDGSGSPWYQGDIGIRGDSIAAIGHLEGVPSRVTIDAHGLTVAPGFIDIHTHSRRGIFQDPAAQNYIRQGVTDLIINGQRVIAGGQLTQARPGRVLRSNGASN